MLSPPPAPKPPAALASMTAFALVALLGFAAPASLAYPGGPSITYSPDALGRPTQVSGYASAVAYHPNGAIAGYTLASGIAHSSTQNTRGLPLLWRDAGVVQDLYAFDADGNVGSITDQQEGLTNRSLGYDGLDRLTSASGIWGAGSFGYDPLDNLRTSAIGARSLNHNIDAATNRLASLTGSQSIAFGYDANGNVSTRGTQAYSFDIGNRMASAAGKATYAYDGHGRRTAVAYTDGSSKVQVYGSNGKLLYTKHSTQGDTRHVYLGERLIAETNTIAGTSYSHTDALGSPVAKTSAAGALLSRTRYEPYGATAAGTNPTAIGFTGHVNDADTGLVYMQQRYQDPIAGRFLSVDPIITDASTGQGFGRYHYANNNPYRYSDPDGRWSPDAHDALINHAFGTRLSRQDIAAIQRASREFDKRTQSPGDANKHSMAQENQSGEDAIRQRDAFVDKTLSEARAAATSGDRAAELVLLGEALHPLMDASSPEHTMPDGTPKEWKGAIRSTLEGQRHSPTDKIGKETTNEITRRIYESQHKVLNKAYDRIFEER